MKKQIYAGIVSYNPDIAEIKQELESLTALNIPIVIVDNNSNNKSMLRTLFNHYRGIIAVIWNDENCGIAKAHNQIMQVCESNGATHVITFDQDSIIPQNIISEYTKHINDDIGVICPTINYLNCENKKKHTSTTVIEREWCIASGSMINIQAWKDVGGFDERMFIDLVDTDFCLRLRRAGYKNIQLTSVVLNHNLGNPITKRILFANFSTTNHSAFRKYYRVRNNIYIARKGLSSPLKAFYHIWVIFWETVFLEPQKKEKMKSIFRGVFEGFKMKIQ